MKKQIKLLIAIAVVLLCICVPLISYYYWIHGPSHTPLTPTFQMETHEWKGGYYLSITSVDTHEEKKGDEYLQLTYYRVVLYRSGWELEYKLSDLVNNQTTDVVFFDNGDDKVSVGDSFVINKEIITQNTNFRLILHEITGDIAGECVLEP